MVYCKVVLLVLLAATARCELPAQGYNYQAPSTHTNTVTPPSNTYLPPHSGFSAPSNNYLPPGSLGSHSHGSFDHGYDHGHAHGHENEAPKSYEFGYSVKDARSGNDYERKETSDGDVVRGQYRVQLPDGRTQIVTYHADWRTGFHADVRYEGTASYPEPARTQTQGGYNYNAPGGFSGSLTGFTSGYKQPSTGYGSPGYH